MKKLGASLSGRHFINLAHVLTGHTWEVFDGFGASSAHLFECVGLTIHLRSTVATQSGVVVLQCDSSVIKEFLGLHRTF